jgi:hypothetical protein
MGRYQGEVQVNKLQINYLRDKIEQSTRTALDIMQRDHRQIVEGQLIVALEDAGFRVNASKYSSILSYVFTDKLKQQEADLQARYNATVEVLRKMKSDAMDALMLGDSKEALSILDKFNADMKELTK